MDANETYYNAKLNPKHAALIFGSDARLSELQRSSVAMGFSISDGTAIADLADHYISTPRFDLLLIDLQSEMERPDRHFSRISDYLEASNVEAVVWTDLDGLERAYAFLPVSRCHFLIDAAAAETMLIIARALRRGKMDLVHGINREVEFSALHRISDELADFARTLARIAEQDEDSGKIGFAEKPVSFRPAPAAFMQPFAAPDIEPSIKISARLIRDAIKTRRLRDRYFNAELFADPAWDILLDLFAARGEGVSVSVSSLCIAAAVPPTTALRWISAMTSNGTLLRRHDPNDARRVFIELSDETAAQLNEYFLEVRRRSGLL